VAERSVRAHAYEQGVPGLFAVELEYRIAMREAELAFTQSLAGQIRAESLDGLALWTGYHRPGADLPAPGEQTGS
jgi:hypothetical protein